MRANSLTTRGVVFAYMFGPPRHVRREEASGFHGAICDKLGMDDIGFRYHASEPSAHPTSRGFSIQLDRKEGRGGFHVIIDRSDPQQPIRCLMEWMWPPTSQHVIDYFDQTGDTLFKALEGPWQPVMAEVRLRAQCDVRTARAIDYIREHLIKLSPNTIDRLGEPLAFASLSLDAVPKTSTSDPLDSPRRQLRLEVLREDPRCIYIELMSQWTQFPVVPGRIDLGSIRPIEEPPSAYVGAAREFLNQWVSELEAEQGED